jgi:amino acid transporter
MGPHLGWLTGWAIIVADIIVMASLAEVAAQYTFSLFGIDVFENPIWPIAVGSQSVDFGVIGLGVLFIAVLTWICYVGIELPARTQVVLLTIELVMLGIFSAVALTQVFSGDVATSVQPSLDWLNPFLFPSPERVFAVFASDNADMIVGIVSSYTILLQGYFLALIVAVPLALWVGWRKRAFDVAYPIAKAVSPVPPTVYLPGIIEQRGEQALTAQCVPLDVELHRVENFRQFLEARRRLLADAVNGFITRYAE